MKVPAVMARLILLIARRLNYGISIDGTFCGGVQYSSLVPTLSANSQNGYVVSASSRYSNDGNGQVYNAFDGNLKIKNWSDHNGGTQYVFVSKNSGAGNGYFQIQFPSATEVNGALVIGPGYKQAGVANGALYGISYSDDGKTFTFVSMNTGLTVNGESSEERTLKEYLALLSGYKKKHLGSHKYWRVHLGMTEEFIGVNQIILF